jgi:hypothetical protein
MTFCHVLSRVLLVRSEPKLKKNSKQSFFREKLLTGTSSTQTEQRLCTVHLGMP